MKTSDIIKILRNATTSVDIDSKREQLAQKIPKIRSMFGYEQQNRAHQYDLWMHCIHTVLNLPKDVNDDMLYLAALLHDIGKPDCQIYDEKDGMVNMHYYGHPIRSMEIVRDEIIPLLSLTEDEKYRLLYYVEHHDDRVSLRIKHVRAHMKLVDFTTFQNLMRLEVADAQAHVLLPIINERIRICTQMAGEEGQALYQKLLKENNEQ